MQSAIEQCTDSEDDKETPSAPKFLTEVSETASLSIPRPHVPTSTEKVDPLEDILDDLLDA